MSGRWFRFYDGALDDPKVQRLHPDLFKLWVNLLCVASRNDGHLAPIADLAFMLRIDERQLSAKIGKLKDAGLIDADVTGDAPHNWSTRQYKSDVSNERVKRHRERHTKQVETVTSNDDVTLHVTAPETETETETETENKSSRRSVAKSNLEPDGFEAFYQTFPKHAGRRAAEKAYRGALRRATADALLEGARVYAASVVGREAQFVKHPATWLNGDHWLDELGPIAGENVVKIDWAAFNTAEEREAQERLRQGNG